MLRVWFWFGAVTSIKVAALASYVRHASAWSGETMRVGNREFEVAVSRAKDGSVYRVRVAVPCDTDLQFTVRRQDALDDWFSKLGLAVEQTVEDSVFDESVYLLSDDRRLAHVLRRKPKLRLALHFLLHADNDEKMGERRLHCRKGRLWIDCRSVRGAKLDPESIVERVASRLTRAARGFRGSLGPAAEELPRDQSFVRAALLLAASTALAINGAVQLLAVGVPHLPIVLDHPALIGRSSLLGAGGLVALLTLCIALLRKTSYARVVAMEVLLTGTFGSMATGYSILRHVNEDTSVEAKLVDVEVRGRRRYECGKNHRSCYALRLSGSPSVEPLTLKLSAAEYAPFAAASTARLTIYPGRLGFRWLARIEPI